MLGKVRWTFSISWILSFESLSSEILKFLSYCFRLSIELSWINLKISLGFSMLFRSGRGRDIWNFSTQGQRERFVPAGGILVEKGDRSKNFFAIWDSYRFFFSKTFLESDNWRLFFPLHCGFLGELPMLKLLNRGNCFSASEQACLKNGESICQNQRRCQRDFRNSRVSLPSRLCSVYINYLTENIRHDVKK